MAFDVQEFKKEYQKKFEELFAYGYEAGSKTEQYIALGDLVLRTLLRGLDSNSHGVQQQKGKTNLLLFDGFLPGRMLKSNLLNMGILDCVRQGMEDMGLDLDEVARAEVDPALGNGRTRQISFLLHGFDRVDRPCRKRQRNPLPLWSFQTKIHQRLSD